MPNITLSYNQSAGGEAAVGSILYRGNAGSPVNYLPLGNVGNEEWSLSTKTADVTNQGTKWERSIPTLLSGGSFTCDLHFIPSSTASDSSGAYGHGFTSGIAADFTNQAILPWKLIFPDGTIEYFVGYVDKFPISMQLEKDLAVKLSIMVIGEPTFA
jgi:hypothetical protein